MSLLCPYCGVKQPFAGSSNVCTECKSEVSRNYLMNARKRAPIWLVTVGYSQHGKTTFVDSMTMTIEKLGKISTKTFSTYLDSATANKIRDIRKEAQEGKLPDATQLPTERPIPMLISLPNFLGNESNTLVVYDLPGEIFDDPTAVEQYADAMRHAQTIWFLISLTDLKKDGAGRTIHDLVQIYVDGLQALGAKAKGKNVVVIYTKADKIKNELPPEVRKYLADDPYAKLVQMSMAEAKEHPFQEYEYQAEMRQISEKLKEYTYDGVDGGVNLINMVDFYEMNLSFAVVSSVPGADGKTVGANQPRYRVLDPLLWALTPTDNGPTEDAEIALIVDGAQDYQTLWDSGLPAQFYDALQDCNVNIKTYVTGHTAPLNSARPEKAPRKPAMRLIGPILDSLPSNSAALIIVNGQIIDLMDYYYSQWHDRIHVVSLNDNPLDWPHKTHFDPAYNSAEEIVSDFLANIQDKH